MLVFRSVHHRKGAQNCRKYVASLKISFGQFYTNTPFPMLPSSEESGYPYNSCLQNSVNPLPPSAEWPKTRKNCTNQWKILKTDTFCRGGGVGNAVLWTKQFHGHLGVADFSKFLSLSLNSFFRAPEKKGFSFFHVGRPRPEPSPKPSLWRLSP